MFELSILGIFAMAILFCVISSLSILYAMIFGFFLFFFYGLWKKYSIWQIVQFSLTGILTIKNILLTFILIGIITAFWRAGGTIPFIVYYALKLCSPTIILLLTFLLCCLISLLTGTAFGTAATMGVICMTIANSTGIPPFYTGGAILAGVYFGDRCSPMSTSALLISELTQTNIFRNIKNMIKTSLVPFFISCTIYLIIGLFSSLEQGVSNIQTVFAEEFNLHPYTLVPAILMIILSLCRFNVKIIMTLSIAASAITAVFLQQVPAVCLLEIAIWGYRPEHTVLASLLSGGGILSMANVFGIVCLSSCYAGIFTGTGFLKNIQNHISKISTRITPFGGILLTSVLTGLVACNQTLTIMLTHQLCQDVEPDTEKFASHLENTAVVIAPLIPWSIASAVPLASVSAPMTCILTACYLYLLPAWDYYTITHPSSSFPSNIPVRRPST